MNSKYSGALTGMQESDKSFLQMYWLAFVFIGIALITLASAAVLALTLSNKQVNTSFPAFILVFFLPALVIVIWRVMRSESGFGIQETYKETSRIGDGMGFSIFWTIISTLLGVAFATLVFSIWEPIRQGRFLYRAWQAHKQGQILVDEAGRPLRAA